MKALNQELLKLICSKYQFIRFREQKQFITTIEAHSKIYGNIEIQMISSNHRNFLEIKKVIPELKKIQKQKHLVKTYEYFFYDQSKTIIMVNEFCDCSLKDILTLNNLTESQVYSITKQLLEGLMEMKKLGITHFDIKLENINYNSKKNIIMYANYGYKNIQNDKQENIVTNKKNNNSYSLKSEKKDIKVFYLDIFSIGKTYQEIIDLTQSKYKLSNYFTQSAPYHKFYELILKDMVQQSEKIIQEPQQLLKVINFSFSFNEIDLQNFQTKNQFEQTQLINEANEKRELIYSKPTQIKHNISKQEDFQKQIKENQKNQSQSKGILKQKMSKDQNQILSKYDKQNTLTSFEKKIHFQELKKKEQNEHKDFIKQLLNVFYKQSTIQQQYQYQIETEISNLLNNIENQSQNQQIQSQNVKQKQKQKDGDRRIKLFSDSLYSEINLKELDIYLYLFNLSEIGVYYLSNALKNLTQLTYLCINLNENPIGDKGIQYLFNSFEYLTQLTKLKLYNYYNNIRDQGIKSISDGFKFLPHLTFLTLGLGHNQIEDEQIQTLVNGFQFIKQLRYLSLGLTLNEITDEGVQILSKGLKTLPLLSDLDIDLSRSYNLKNKDILDQFIKQTRLSKIYVTTYQPYQF